MENKKTYQNKIPYQHLSVMIIPTDFCNMNCVYCFNGRRREAEGKKMSAATLRRIFEITLPYYREIRYIFHGGEPLLAGIRFYEEVVRLQKELNVNNCRITNSIQTNLSLMSEEYAEFFVKNHFHIGSSYDGTRNEETRHNSAGIMRGYDHLREAGGKCGFIYVVQARNVLHLIEDYEWFKSEGKNFTLNIYLANSDEPDDPLKVDASVMASKIAELFDYWLLDTDCNINIFYFEHFVRYFLFKEKSLCCYNSCLGKHVGFRYDGEIFNCNRDFPADMSFGNADQYTDIHECFQSAGFNKLLSKAIIRRRHCKETCEIYDFCSGGCNSAALASGDMEKENAFVCSVLKGVYSHIQNVLQGILCRENDDPAKYCPFVKKSLEEYRKRGS